MSERIPYQYSTLQYMHDSFTGEFLNVGLVVYSHKANYIRSELLTRYKRISDTFKEVDGEYYRSYVFRLQDALTRLEKRINTPQIVLPGTSPQRLSGLLAEVLPADDSALRFAPVRQGADDSLDRAFDALFDRLVNKYAEPPIVDSRDDEDVWQSFRKPLQDAQVLQHLAPHKIKTPYETFDFAHAWKNGAWNILQPVSLDLSIGTRIRSKARLWVGNAQILADAPDLHQVFLLLGRPHNMESELSKAYRDATSMLREKTSQLNIELVEEGSADSFANKIRPLVEEHPS